MAVFLTTVLGMTCILCNAFDVSSVPTQNDTETSSQPDVEAIDSDSKPDICKDAKIDAITTTHADNTYAFKGDWYWKILNEGIADGYPKQIAHHFKGLPGHIDAALTMTTGDTYLFKGAHFWKFNETKNSHGQTIIDAYSGYPKEISQEFPGIPNQLDAAFQWKNDGYVYFFKGGEYWQWKPYLNPHVDPRYPAAISEWAGLPEGGIHAAFDTQYFSFFFRNDQYYRIEDAVYEVSTDREYPVATSHMWFKCPEGRR